MEIKPLDIIRWRGRLGVFLRKTKTKAVIRLSGLRSDYRVSIHELRRAKVEGKLSLKTLIKDDPLRSLIRKTPNLISKED